MLKLSLIGKDISHSKSEEVYTSLLKDNFEYYYLDFNSSSVIDLQKIVKSYNGVSVTSPYKNFAYKNSLNFELEEIEAVNCLKIKDEKIYGINTDYKASLDILSNFIPKINRIIVLGSGSMSKVIGKVCRDKKIDLINLSRKNTNISKVTLYDAKDSLVVNCCAREFDLSAEDISKSYLWDLNYNQFYTKDLKKKLNDRFLDGYSLLINQAKLAIEFWGI